MKMLPLCSRLYIRCVCIKLLHKHGIPSQCRWLHINSKLLHFFMKKFQVDTCNYTSWVMKFNANITTNRKYFGKCSCVFFSAFCCHKHLNVMFHYYHITYNLKNIHITKDKNYSQKKTTILTSLLQLVDQNLPTETILKQSSERFTHCRILKFTQRNPCGNLTDT